MEEAEISGQPIFLNSATWVSCFTWLGEWVGDGHRGRKEMGVAWGRHAEARIGKESEDKPKWNTYACISEQKSGIFIGSREVTELSISSKGPEKGGGGVRKTREIAR